MQTMTALQWEVVDIIRRHFKDQPLGDDPIHFNVMRDGQKLFRVSTHGAMMGEVAATLAAALAEIDWGSPITVTLETDGVTHILGTWRKIFRNLEGKA